MIWLNQNKVEITASFWGLFGEKVTFNFNIVRAHVKYNFICGHLLTSTNHLHLMNLIEQVFYKFFIIVIYNFSQPLFSNTIY